MSPRFSIPITLRSLGRGFHVVPEDEVERAPAAAPPAIDYTPLANAAQDVALWLLDVARSRTRDPIDLSAIGRVQRALIAAVAGTPLTSRPPISEEDVLTVAGILLTAFEVDLGVPGLSAAAGSLYDATDSEIASVHDLVADAIAHRAASAMAAAIVARASAATPSAIRIVPVLVRRRPRIVDEDALADVLDDIASTR